MLLALVFGCQPACDGRTPAVGAASVDSAVNAAPASLGLGGEVRASEAVAGVTRGAGRIDLALQTIGIPPRPLAVVGVRTDRVLEGPLDFAYTLGWPAEQNASYLDAAVYLTPHRTAGDPALLDDWVRVSFVGIPPGDAWRRQVTERRAGRLKYLDREGWPAKRIARRKPVSVTIRWRDGVLEVVEAGRPNARMQSSKWPRTYVYLTLTGHSNYPRRTVHFGVASFSD